MIGFIRHTGICLFIVLLFLPMAFFVMNPQKEVSRSENRRLTLFPAIDLDDFSLRRFSTEFESYWNDHFGLREEIISFNAFLQYKLLNKSPVRKVIRGGDGYLFINLESIVSDYLGTNPPSSETLASWTRTLENRQRWLGELGIRYVLLPVPSKMNIYSEYLPPQYTFFRSATGRTTLESLLEYLQTGSSFLGAVDLPSLFRREKKRRQLYFKTDTHWTWQGAYLAHRELVAKLRQWFPEMKPITEEELDLVDEARNGDLTKMLGSKDFTAEPTKLVSIRNSCEIKSFKLPNHDTGTTRRHPLVTTCDTAQLTAVVTYDSFGAFLEPYYSSLFKRVTYVSRYDSVWLKGFLQREKPDVFIHQRAARKLGDILHDQWGLDSAVDRDLE